ncbi:MAG: nitric-oxide reductase large subunit, partial [Gammaproteobacteria bacterium]|nr:nitric-oxide reductase large subunit [Gammaproteobacteria bacterium]
LAMISYTMPFMNHGKPANSQKAQVIEMWGFWLMTVSIVFITLFLTGAGILQIWLQRMGDNPQSFMATQDSIEIFYWLRFIAGWTFLGGLVTFFYSFFAGGEPLEEKA